MTTPTPTDRHARERGEQTRERIREAIHSRHQCTSRWPTLDEIVGDTGFGKSTVRWHIDWMASQQVPQVRIEPARREIVLLDGAPT